MIEIVLPYSIVTLFGLFGVVVSIIRMWVAEDSAGLKKGGLALIGAILMILISLGAIYFGVYEILSPVTVAFVSLGFLILNCVVFWRYSKPE